MPRYIGITTAVRLPIGSLMTSLTVMFTICLAPAQRGAGGTGWATSKPRPTPRQVSARRGAGGAGWAATTTPLQEAEKKKRGFRLRDAVATGAGCSGGQPTPPAPLLGWQGGKDDYVLLSLLAGEAGRGWLGDLHPLAPSPFARGGER